MYIITIYLLLIFYKNHYLKKLVVTDQTSFDCNCVNYVNYTLFLFLRENSFAFSLFLFFNFVVIFVIIFFYCFLIKFYFSIFSIQKSNEFSKCSNSRTFSSMEEKEKIYKYLI